MEKRCPITLRLWSKLPRRFRGGLLVAGASLLIGLSAAWSQAPRPAPSKALPEDPEERVSTSAAEEPGKERLREGTELQEAKGYFRFVDDRVVFLKSSGDFRCITLENLNLERIVSEITNNPTQLEWTVVGTITEYRGTNYLLVRRAVLSHSKPEFAKP